MKLKSLLRNSSNFLTRRQTNILSAAMVIMVMIAISRVLGLVRNRVLAHFFSVETLALYFAAFRLPEVIFEVLVFGTLSSAFIPTFTAYLSRKKEKEAWYLAGVSLNIAVLIFLLLAAIIFLFARPLYRVIAAGFTPDELGRVALLTRILLLAQGFFVLSYFLTGVLESLQRFLIPAVAPLFYNLGIILGTYFLSSRWGIYAPAFGAVIGALSHFAIQLPLALRLGFRPQKRLDFRHPGVRKIARLAAPRLVELSFLQVGKSVELFLASLISTAAYTYFTFASSLQLLPIGLFGTSIAKASLPALAYQAARQDRDRFKETFLASFNEILFLVIPCSVFLVVLRVPAVRLVFGAARFTWASTVETGYTLSAFSLAIVAQALIYLLTRAFYALHDTVTPVKISIGSIFLNILFSVLFVIGLRWPVWSLALSCSLASVTQAIILTAVLNKKATGFPKRKLLYPFLKITFSALTAAGVMFILLKILDRSVWDKRLSFLGRFGLMLPTTFDRFVLDTRYTLNLIYLTSLVLLVGGTVYLFLAWVLKIEEIKVFSRFLTKMRKIKPFQFRSRTAREKEPLTLGTKEF